MPSQQGSTGELATPLLAGPRPRALIVTVFGAFVRPIGSWLSISDLIRLMSDLNIEEQTVRSSISRLKRRGFLVAEHRARIAGYRLSREADRILAAGDSRIYRSAAGEHTSGWILAIFSVPEVSRHKRHVLRSRLAGLGFGHVASGTWAGPAELERDLREMLDHDELGQYATIFRGEFLAGPRSLTEAVANWWDLEAIGAQYRLFVGANMPILAAWQHRSAMSNALAFADYVRALTQWRRLPYLDPGLPSSVLSDDWPGATASALFAALREQLEEPSRQHVLDVTSATRSRAEGCRFDDGRT